MRREQCQGNAWMLNFMLYERTNEADASIMLYNYGNNQVNHQPRGTTNFFLSPDVDLQGRLNRQFSSNIRIPGENKGILMVVIDRCFSFKL